MKQKAVNPAIVRINVINNNPLLLQQALDLIYLKFLDLRICIDLIAAMLTVADIREQDIALII